MLQPELFIGVLAAVSSNSVRLNLTEAGQPSGSHFFGARYGNGEVGEFVLIEGQINLLLGRIIEIHLPEKERRYVTATYTKNHDLDVVGKIQLLGSVAADTLKITAGVKSYPRLGDRVYSAPHHFIADIPNLMEQKTNLGNGIELQIGHIGTTQENTVSIRPEKLFGRHCAILGTTGGGKSWTTARIIEECQNFNAKIILVDATNEYRSISGDSVAHVHLGVPTEKANYSKSRSLPPTCFVESDFVALFEPAGKVQGPKMRAAIRSLRLAKLCPDVAENGVIKKIEQPKLNIENAEKRTGISEKLDDPRQEFDVSKLVSQIEQECVWPEGFKVGGARGQKDPTKWGGESGDFSHCLSLVARINAILTSPAFQCIFQSKDDSLTKEIDEFVTKKSKKLLRICLSGIAHEFKAREIIANAIGRYLLNKARAGTFKQSPIVIFVDEAHSFLGRQIGAEDSVAKLDSFELIAKEGRKFGLNICLATQRPRDVTEGVLSQIGTLVVHRLTNERDRDVVERACGEIDRSASSFLPNLKPGRSIDYRYRFSYPTDYSNHTSS